ncbi:MAG: hypothetical protein KGP28_11705 [Bdellovibrionales bacterium]|nr:hypothetical protein [Bdellovibrionales bacterium]
MRPRVCLFLLLFALLSRVTTAHSQELLYEAYPGSRPIGNTLLRNESIEAVVRGMIARSLNADLSGGRLDFDTQSFDQTIELPDPKPGLKEILDVLGIRDTLALAVSPLHIRMALPESSLKITVAKKSENTFEVLAAWQVSELKVDAKTVSIKVPAGAFDRPFVIESNGVSMGLTRRSSPIRLELKLLFELNDLGSRIRVTGYKTNLTDRAHPNFFVELGKLTLDRKPLRLQILSNGQSLIAEEPAIRDQFQQSEPQIVRTLRSKVSDAIEENIKSIAEKIESAPLIKFSLNSSEVIEPSGFNQNLKELLSGIQMDFIFSYLQYIQESKLFSAQIAGRFCVDESCLANIARVSPIGTKDVSLMTPQDDAGVVLYESIVQDIIHSERFQARIRKYFNTENKTAGVALASSGLRLRFDPASGSVNAIVNLDIDIIKTIKAKSSFGERLRLSLGDLIEYYFGSGKTVKIPLEIKFKLNGITEDPSGQANLGISVSLPFTPEGSFLPPRNCPPGWCQSNVDSMTSVVKTSFMKTIRQEFQAMLPATMVIPMSRPITVRDFAFKPKTVRITPNHGLLISGDLKDEGGKRK